MSRVMIAAVFAAVLGGNARIAVAQVFQGLGTLPGGAFDVSTASGVSADGSVVVGGSSSASGGSAFIWDPVNGMQALPHSPGGFTYSHAYAVSADGLVVVGRGNNANGIEAFIWDAAHGMRGLGALSSIDFLSYAQDVSADGSVVVGFSRVYDDGFVDEAAFIWDTINGMQQLADANSHAWGVSADGTVVVGNSGATGGAFIWDATNGLQGLGDLPGGFSPSTARDVSSDGRYVVGNGDGPPFGREPFIWDAINGTQVWGNLSSHHGSAQAVSADGSVVVGSSDNEAFIRDPVNGMRSLKQVLGDDYGVNLNLTGWELTLATDVSDDGTVIVGEGYNPAGDREAWRVDLNAPMFDKWLLTGPDRNGDGMADLAIAAGESELVEYSFKIRINRPNLSPVRVRDVVPPQWYVISCVPERRSDVVTVRSSGRSGTMIEWQPEGNQGSLEVTIRTRGQSAGRRRRDARRPNALVKLVPGALVLNDGALALVPHPPYFEDGPQRLVTPKLCVAVVEDLNGDGIDPTGNGDEDRDGLTDFQEAGELGTNPSDSDTDRDGIPDGQDAEPLRRNRRGRR